MNARDHAAPSRMMRVRLVAGRKSKDEMKLMEEGRANKKKSTAARGGDLHVCSHKANPSPCYRLVVGSLTQTWYTATLLA